MNLLDSNTLLQTHQPGAMGLVAAAHSKWLNAGAKVVGDPSAEVSVPELLTACRLDFSVSKVPAAGLLQLEDGSIQPLEMEAVFGALKTFPDGSREMIPGVATGKKYQCVQNADAFAIVEALRQQGALRPQAAGHLRQGALSWLFSTLTTREVRRLDGSVDPIEYHLLSVNSFDGSTRVVHGLTPRNMRCDNALFSTLAGLQTQFSFSHTRSAPEAVELAGRVIPQLVAATENVNAVFQELAEQKMGVKQFSTFARKWLDEEYGALDDDAADEDRTAREELQNALVSYFRTGIGNSGCSAWDGFMSVTEFLDHHRDRFRKAVRTAKHLQNDLQSNLFGSAHKAKSRALRLLRRA